jgi:hypothetical protein
MKISLWTDTEDEKQAILDLTKKTFGDVEIGNIEISLMERLQFY